MHCEVYETMIQKATKKITDMDSENMMSNQQIRWEVNIKMLGRSYACEAKILVKKTGITISEQNI